MRSRLLVALVAVAGFMVASSLNASAEEATADGIKSRPTAADAQKYRPKNGCFGTGTRNSAGNTQVVCR
jgi:hypothetical protein